jgi:hypothetical protein
VRTSTMIVMENPIPLRVVQLAEAAAHAGQDR